ncbi:DUF4179 domain-containing protein [Cohnella mopanensis]|uniref:DUF4179 domain-containing protein n=1 Tax=Cohnella mopanensis TaxID=2911966 RepID=UPI001EF876DE|nr:DUF4179 domain-containing protein [Cohnella mopanensis]
MNQDRLTHTLHEHKDSLTDPIPDTIRESLDHTYEQLEAVDIHSIRSRYRSRRRFKRAGLSAAAVLAAVGLVIGSGVVSPAMASTLKKIPWINSLYEQFGDAGLAAASRNGMVTEETYSLMKAGRTVTISNVMYDGARLSAVVKVQGEKKLPDYVIGTFSVKAKVNGEQGPYSFSMGVPKRIDDKTLLRIINMGHAGYDGSTEQAYEFPDKFELSLSIGIAKRKGVDNGIYDFKIPIEKNAPGAIVLTSSEVKKYDEVTLSIERLEITPATIHLVTLLGNSSKGDLFSGRRFLRYALFDESGNEFNYIYGGGAIAVGDKDLSKGTQDYEGPVTMPKAIIIKPYIWNIEGKDGKESRDYIKELEITIAVP